MKIIAVYLSLMFVLSNMAVKNVSASTCADLDPVEKEERLSRFKPRIANQCEDNLYPIFIGIAIGCTPIGELSAAEQALAMALKLAADRIQANLVPNWVCACTKAVGSYSDQVQIGEGEWMVITTRVFWRACMVRTYPVSCWAPGVQCCERPVPDPQFGVPVWSDGFTECE